MSKDIWHITNQDEHTTDVPEKENLVVLIGHWTSCLWYGGETPEPIFWENVKKWCYLDDLLALETELERTRKALDVAKDKLDTVRQYHRGTAVIRPDDIAAYCDRAIEQITAPEQKDVK